MNDANLERLLDTLDTLLRCGHVDSARLIIAEVRHQRLEEPGTEPLTFLPDDVLATLSKRLQEETFRRQWLVRPR